MRSSSSLFLLTFVLLVSCVKDKPEINLQSYPIPGDRFFPEGIAYDSRAGVFYTGSTILGDVVKVNVETGFTQLFSSGAKAGRSFLTGMKLDHKDRLWVCGGDEGKVHLLDKDGESIKVWDLRTQFGAGFVNDCALDKQDIYFTDSRVQKIYRANVSQANVIEEWLSFTNQEIPYATTGTNANGIVLTPDGKYLIIVVSSSGKLYRIDRTSKAIQEITLSAPVTSGDGLVLDGSKLYVSRNALNKVFRVVLNNTYTNGIVGDGFGDNLLFNTTMAKAGKYLLVVNGQLNRRPNPNNPNPTPPVLPFTVSRVPIP